MDHRWTAGSSSLTLLLLFIAAATEKEAASRRAYVLSASPRSDADLLAVLLGDDGSRSIMV